MKSGTSTPFWGKLTQDATADGRVGWLPLTAHCLDVAWTFRVLVDVEAFECRLGAAAGKPLNSGQKDRLAVLAALHDVGKANLAFQERPFRSTPGKAGHIKAIAAVLKSDLVGSFAGALQASHLATWFDDPDGLTDFLVASWSHHGAPFDRDDDSGVSARWWRPNGSRDPMTAVAEIVAAAEAAFPSAFEVFTSSLPTTAELQHRFAGLLMLSDWIGSHTTFFPLHRDDSFDPRRAAQHAVNTVGLSSEVFRSAPSLLDGDFERRFAVPPYPIQVAAGIRTVTSLARAEDRLVVIESETGSGKTEAALHRFLDLFAAKHVSSLYFALPTRVAARELYSRVLAVMAAVFPDADQRPLTVLAVPGYALADGVAPERAMPPASALWHDDDLHRSQERHWAAEHPKRFLAAMVAVGTIDQALLSCLQTRHAHLRSVCLDRSLLVVDEVHASDPYMCRLLRSLLEHHIGQGGHALLLSATLGSRMRESCLHVTGIKPRPISLTAARDLPYPSITTGRGRTAAIESGTAAKRVEIECVQIFHEPTRVSEIIGPAIADNGRVLVIMNTVARALTVQRALESQLGIGATSLFRCRSVVCPHHGRFAAVDRVELDNSVTARLGKDSMNGPLVLVGTQTLEQSLDIDADVLVTDLCPMDVLLQRIGRLHRHRRPRPASLSTARCIVLVTPDADLSNLLTENGEAIATAKRSGLGSVYADLRVIERTRAQIASGIAIVVPADSRRLVEDATHPESLGLLTGHRWEKHARLIEGIVLGQRLAAADGVLDFSRRFAELRFHEPGIAVRTRLGLDDRQVYFAEPPVGPFGLSIPMLRIPAHLVRSPVDVDNVAVVVFDGGFTFHLGDSRYRYSRHGLELGVDT